MDLSIVVDRGDVWYDLPFDEKGGYKPQVRKKYPSLTLYAKAGGKQVALARWRTTIGGWRRSRRATATNTSATRRPTSGRASFATSSRGRSGSRPRRRPSAR